MQDSIIGRLGFSSDCMDEEVLPYRKDTTFVSIYELITYGTMTRNYHFEIGKPYKVKLRERNCIKSNEIIFDYNPPIVKKEKPKFGKFNSQFTDDAYQIYADVLDDNVSIDSLWIGSYHYGKMFSKQKMKINNITGEKLDSFFIITIPDTLVNEIIDSTLHIEFPELILTTIFLKDSHKAVRTYFHSKTKD